MSSRTSGMLNHGKPLFLLIFGIIILETISVSTAVNAKRTKKTLESISNPQKLPNPGEKSKGKNGVPTIAKIFEDPKPDDGYEGLRAFSRELKKGMFNTQLYNTSIALTSALFSFQLPSNDDTEATSVNMANQTIFGLFAMLTAVLVFGLPVLFTGQKFVEHRRSSDESSGIISQILKAEPLASLISSGFHEKIGVEPEKCLQKTICEAHRSPENKRYGMLAIPFQVFYPPQSKVQREKVPATSFQDAAYTGKYQKTKCDKKYKCFFDVLDLSRYLLEWYQYHNGGLGPQS